MSKFGITLCHDVNPFSFSWLYVACGFSKLPCRCVEFKGQDALHIPSLGPNLIHSVEVSSEQIWRIDSIRTWCEPLAVPTNASGRARQHSDFPLRPLTYKGINEAFKATLWAASCVLSTSPELGPCHCFARPNSEKKRKDKHSRRATP